MKAASLLLLSPLALAPQALPGGHQHQTPSLCSSFLTYLFKYKKTSFQLVWKVVSWGNCKKTVKLRSEDSRTTLPGASGVWPDPKGDMLALGKLGPPTLC